jgi:hypothetical protein
MKNCEGCEKKRSLTIFRYFLNNFLEGLRKSANIPFRIKVSSNPAFPEYETKVLTAVS